MDTKIRKFVVVSLVVVFIAGGITQAKPVLSQSVAANSVQNGRIAFYSDRDGNFEIYVMNADGTRQTRLTNNTEYDWGPTWSPDGNKIAFESYRDGNGEIYVMNADGSGQTNLSNDPDWWDGGASWSPDGEKIVFESVRDGNGEIYVVNADGSGQTNLTNNPAIDWYPAWSPDGSKIAFESNRDGNFSEEIYIMNANGSEQTNLTNNLAWAWGFAWSPDGGKIVFYSDPDGTYEIYVMNADGTGQTRLTNNTLDDVDPVWSPDGKKIAFTSWDRAEVKWKIYIINADGTGVTRLTNYPGDEVYPTWSLDGSKIAFVSTDTGNGEIYVVNADGSELTNLTNNLADDGEPAWEPTLRAWTLMFYLDADNNLDNTYPPIFNQLETAASNPNVQVLVVWDRLGRDNSAYYKVQYDTNLRDLANYTVGVNYWPKGELNMGDPATVVDFVNWARTNYPAQHYALILSNHGSGLGGGMVDSTSSGDKLTVNEIGIALAFTTNNGTNKIDTLYLDACLMAMIEDAYQLRSYIDYYVASENLQWTYTAAYSRYISEIVAGTAPSQLAVLFATGYADEESSSSVDYTISAANVSKLDDLVVAVDSLASLLRSQMSTYGGTLETIAQTVQRFDNGEPIGTINPDDEYVDLYDFARLVKVNITDSGIQTAAQSVMDAVNAYIVPGSEHHQTKQGTAVGNSHGVSIFFPRQGFRRSFYTGLNLEFANGTVWGGVRQQEVVASLQDTIAWGPMLVEYVGQVYPEATDDPELPELMPRQQPNIVYLPIVLRNR